MKILVCGGRHFANARLLSETLDRLRPTLLCEGGAPGADHLAQQYAIKRHIPLESFTTPNLESEPQLDLVFDFAPDLVLAFLGGRGTATMVRLAKAAGVPVEEVL